MLFWTGFAKGIMSLLLLEKSGGSMIDLGKFKVIAERLYMGICDVYEYEGGNKGLIKLKEVKVLENLPCRISYRNNYNNAKSKTTGVEDYEAPSSRGQTVILFTAPDVNIKPGSKVVVTQNGRTVAYNCSGQPVVYQTHQEIALELFKKFA